MGLQFLHTALLWGLGLALVPILIHLLRRRLVRRHRLPTFDFLLRTQRRITNRSRLRNWILLFLRVCAVGLVVFLASRPLLATEGGVSSGGWFPVHTLAVIDNSASMAYETPRGSRFELAKRAVRRMIEEMGEADRISILTTAGPAPEGPPKELTRKEALAALEAIRRTDDKGAPTRVVRRAIENASPGAGRRNVVVLSDFARGDWESFQVRNVREWNPHAHLQFVRVAPEAGVADLSLRDVKMKPWPPKAGFSFTIGARVFNRGEEEKSKVAVSLYLGEELRETVEVDVPPNGSSPVSFRVNAPQRGVLEGRVQLPPDALPTTNRFYFAASIGKRLRALIVDGDPKRGLQDSETFFLVNALSAAPPGGESPVLTRVVAGYEMNSVRWEEYDYVVACNVGRWTEEGVRGLRNFVEKGGGLLWASGELASGAELDWLPATFGAPRTLRPAQSLKIASGMEAHPAFSLLGSGAPRFFSALRVARIAPLAPARGGAHCSNSQAASPPWWSARRARAGWRCGALPAIGTGRTWPCGRCSFPSYGDYRIFWAVREKERLLPQTWERRSKSELPSTASAKRYVYAAPKGASACSSLPNGAHLRNPLRGCGWASRRAAEPSRSIRILFVRACIASTTPTSSTSWR